MRYSLPKADALSFSEKQHFKVQYHVEFWCHPFLTHPYCPQTQNKISSLCYTLEHISTGSLNLPSCLLVLSEQSPPIQAYRTVLLSVAAEQESWLYGLASLNLLTQ